MVVNKAERSIPKVKETNVLTGALTLRGLLPELQRNILLLKA